MLAIAQCETRDALAKEAQIAQQSMPRFQFDFSFAIIYIQMKQNDLSKYEFLPPTRLTNSFCAFASFDFVLG